MIRKLASISLLLGSCCVNLETGTEGGGGGEQSMSVPPEAGISLDVATAGVELELSDDNLVHIEAQGGLNVDTANGLLRACELQGAKAKIKVPAGTAVSIECEMSKIEGRVPDSCDIKANLSGVEIKNWKSGTGSFFMSGGEIHLSPEFKNLELNVKWSGVKLFVPEGLGLNITKELKGGKIEVEDGIVSEDGVPVVIKVKSGAVEVKREKF